MEGSVWRVALKGPEKYHKMVLADELMRLRKNDKYARGMAVDLTDAEADEYIAYKEFLKEKGVEIATNEEFYGEKRGPGRPKKVV